MVKEVAIKFASSHFQRGVCLIQYPPHHHCLQQQHPQYRHQHHKSSPSSTKKEYFRHKWIKFISIQTIVMNHVLIINKIVHFQSTSYSHISLSLMKVYLSSSFIQSEGCHGFCLRARPIELGQCNYVVLPSTLPPRHHCQHHQQHHFRGDCSSWPLKEFLIKTAMKKQKLAAVASKVSLSCLAV